jgi:hypothetical protein
MAAEDQRVFAEEVRDSSENRRKEQEDSRQTAEAAHRAAEEIRSALMSDVPPCLNSARSQREMSETLSAGPSCGSDGEVVDLCRPQP